MRSETCLICLLDKVVNKCHNYIMKIKKDNQNKSLIPNKQIEEMFFRMSNDEEVQRYMALIEQGFMPLATAYASNKVTKKFFEMIEKQEISK